MRLDVAPRAERHDAPSSSSGPPAARRVLLVQHASNLNGSTLSGLLVARSLRRAGWEVDVAFAEDGPGIALYRDAGCSAQKVAHKNWLRAGRILPAVRCVSAELVRSQAFVRILRRARYDLVYVNSLVSLAAAVAARRLRIPCVWHIRELFDDVGGEMRIPPILGKAGVRRVIRGCAQHIVLLSRAVGENVLPADGGTTTTVVANAVGDEYAGPLPDRDECRARLGLTGSGAVIGVPGTLRPVKGHEFFLESAALVAARRADCRFLIAGDGEAEFVGRLRDRVTSAGLESRIRFVGTMQSMPEFYRACDFVCVPSRSESFGRTVIEAFAMQTPVIATAVGGIREVIEPGRTGLLVEYGDVPGLCQAIERLLDDGEFRERLSAAARREVETHYAADVHQTKITGVVEAALQSAARSDLVPDRARS